MMPLMAGLGRLGAAIRGPAPSGYVSASARQLHFPPADRLRSLKSASEKRPILGKLCVKK